MSQTPRRIHTEHSIKKSDLLPGVLNRSLPPLADMPSSPPGASMQLRPAMQLPAATPAMRPGPMPPAAAKRKSVPPCGCRWPLRWC